MVKLIYYLDVMSSWCFYAEPQIELLRRKYGQRLAYEWRIALITEDQPHGYTHEQVAWFYKRSGSISGVQLNPDWCQGPHNSLYPNLAAEAARELGFGDDRVRLALARAAMIEGMPIYHKSESTAVLSAVTGVEPGRVSALMEGPKVSNRVKESSQEFASFRIDQRPGFVLHSSIGDTAIFSGIWAMAPLEATVVAMLSDVDKYAKFAAANPPMPAR